MKLKHLNGIVNLALTDFKLIFRDPSLRSFLLLPIILFVFVLWLLPMWVDQYDFLVPYLPVFLIVAVVENTQMFCFISSMVLIDEKETQVTKVYGVLPLTAPQYILSRLLIPFLFTVLLNVVLIALQPFYPISWWENLLIAVLAGMVVPVYVLAMNSYVSNRMQGMIYVKAFNMLVLLPIAAFFVPQGWKGVFAILPTHWLFQSIDAVVDGSDPALIFSIGFSFMIFLTAYFARLFMSRHFV